MPKKISVSSKQNKTVKKPIMNVIATTEHFFEVDGEQVKIDVDDVKNRIYEAYKNDGHRPGNIKTLQIYYNLLERKAYYVINGKEEGKAVEI